MDLCNLDLTTISLGPQRTNANGGKYMPVLINGKDAIETKLLIQSHEGLRTPFGLNAPYSGDVGPKQTLPVEADAAFEAKVRELDAHIRNLVEGHSQAIFGAPKSEAILREMYRPLIHEGTPGYAPTIPVKVKVGGVGMTTVIEKATAHGFVEATPDCLVRGARVLALVRLGSVWIQGKTQFGITLEAHRLVHRHILAFVSG